MVIEPLDSEHNLQSKPQKEKANQVKSSSSAWQRDIFKQLDGNEAFLALWLYGDFYSIPLYKKITFSNNHCNYNNNIQKGNNEYFLLLNLEYIIISLKSKK